MNDLSDIFQFQLRRGIINLLKDTLNLLEDRHNHIKELENLLVKMGIDKYNEPKFDYEKDRKYELTKFNDLIRELEEFISKLEITVRK